MSTRALLRLCFGALALAPPARADAQETPGERLPVHEFALQNGMRFLVLPQAGAPTVSFVTEFAVGGVNERAGATGIVHLLEHMLFKGTSTIGTRDVGAERALFARMDAAHDTLLVARAAGDSIGAAALVRRIEALEDTARTYVVPNELDRIFTEAGARGLNATTSNDATTYFVELPANRAELWFALESDRMSDPVFREYYTERNVVTEERRLRVDASPFGHLYEEHLRAAFTLHPYGQPVVGTMSDLESLGRGDVESYYRRFYGPNNAVVAIVGDVEPDVIETWARRYFDRIPRGEAPPPVSVVEPRQVAERRIEIPWDAEPRLRIGWHVPSSLHEDAPALGILAAVLTGGRTSRLQRRLVTADQIATAVSASTGPGQKYPQLFFIDAVPRSPHATDELERAIYEEVARLAAEGPTAPELERVRNQIAAGNVRRIESNLGLAFQLAASESLAGDWRSTFRQSARLSEVTSDDVRRVAAAYLTTENRTVAVLVRREAP
jgi:predicted Zn-dependent peptidase